MEKTPLGHREDFRSLVDHLDGMAVWVVSAPGEFDYISAGFEDVWGIPPEELEADPSRLFETIHPDDRERVRAAVEESRESLSEEVYEGRVVRPDGTVRWVLTRQFPVDGSGDGPIVVGVSTDITEVKRREEELEALNRIVRHDIRNDLNVVLGWADLLGDHVDDQGSEYLGRIQRAGEHVVELTQVARDYAESITGGETLDVHPVSLRSVLETELALRRDAYPDADVVLHGDIPDVTVGANEMLSSVFRNLVNNAVQHNDSDDPRVEVSCETRDGTVVVRVADNGPGIPESHRDLVFEKDRKGIESTGTGVGLYLVGTLVDQYDGDVRIEDNEPTGSVFVVELPLADGAPEFEDSKYC